MTNSDPSEARIADQVESKGYAIVRDLFTPSEVRKMRSELLELFGTRVASYTNLGKVQNNAALEVDEISWIYSHPKVVAAFRQALRTDNIIFTGVCDLHMNRLSGWHKDSGDSLGGYFKGDYYNSNDCRVYKMAIYLQDHTTNEAGLSIRENSHHTRDIHCGKEEYLPTRAGDVILFDVRATHIGQKPNLVERKLMGISSIVNRRDLTKPDSSPFVWLKDLYWFLLGRDDRLAVFLCYGYPNQQTENYSRSHLYWQLRQYKGTLNSFPQKLVSDLRALGIGVAEVVSSPFGIGDV